MIKKVIRRGYKTLLTQVPFFKKAPFFKNLMILVDHNLVFVRVPKAGCSTVIARLLAEIGEDVSNNLHSENDLVTYERADFAKRLSGLTQGRAKLFTVVRNPYTRVLSAYSNKISHENDGLRYRAELGLPHKVEVNFEQFVDALTRMNPLALDMHFMPQSLILAQDSVQYDAIFHLEDMQACLDWLDGLLPDSAEKKAAIIAPHATNANARVKSLYTPEIKAKIEAYYADDFALLGYYKDLDKVGVFEEAVALNQTPLTGVSMSRLLKLDNSLRAKLPVLLNRH